MSASPWDGEDQAASDGEQMIQINDVRLFDGESVHDEATVVLDGERIVAVAHRSLLAPPGPGHQLVVGRGHTLLPGLIDACAHVPGPTLSLGVTTELDMFPAELARASAAVDELPDRLPTTLVCSHVTDVGSVRTALAQQTEIIANLPVDEPLPEDLVERITVQGAAVVPSLTRVELSARNPISTRATTTVQTRGGLHHAMRSTRMLHEAGVMVLAGSHGASLHRELELLVLAGLSPVDALSAATSVPADVFGLTDRGYVEAGRQADLVLVAGDPCTDITATRMIKQVWRAGTQYVP
ncbi:amidohydrolase family protein [Actinocrispum sp. NPDC049592]|uniref:amidohydrolase family protein n=1 Tax=Actinocrispum sp. NPDC049592 TaxID=3154835 RepID=UPI0034208432